MANAPVYIKDGEPTTLVNIDKVYATKQKAETNAATTIHVERGLAKVTVASFPKDLSPTGTIYNSDKVEITAWNLDVTNKSTFPIHKTTGLNSPLQQFGVPQQIQLLQQVVLLMQLTLPSSVYIGVLTLTIVLI